MCFIHFYDGDFNLIWCVEKCLFIAVFGITKNGDFLTFFLAFKNVFLLIVNCL
ncbi:hypothetical protein FEM08_19460 [Flavobacterium gilvum]|nr:hypothetical protein FEM08_19460 [Flavobacterium gilvum]